MTSAKLHHCTEVHFASFLSGGFITVIVVNPPERKLAKRTSVHWGHINIQGSVNWFSNYSSKGAQNILTILNMKNGSQQIPNITTTDVIILMDFFFLAIKFISLPSSLLPEIKDTKYKVHPWRLSLVSSNTENISQWSRYVGEVLIK